MRGGRWVEKLIDAWLVVNGWTEVEADNVDHHPNPSVDEIEIAMQADRARWKDA